MMIPGISSYGENNHRSYLVPTGFRLFFMHYLFIKKSWKHLTDTVEYLNYKPSKKLFFSSRGLLSSTMWHNIFSKGEWRVTKCEFTKY